MSDVLKSFTGKFKDRKNDYSNWLTATNVPEPHPAAVGYSRNDDGGDDDDEG